MGDTKWTDEQLEAITDCGRNMLVAAAAGAGKTAVLVERIIRKITDETSPLDIDRLLIVTFTNAAATEMRERIGNAIAKALDSNPESGKLQRQMALLSRASITTIHSFCLEVIKNNFQSIQLDPGFRIADETEAALMKMEALEEIFEEMYEQETLKDEFLELVDCYGGKRDDSALQEMVLTLYEFVQSYPWPEKWLVKSYEAFNLPDGKDFGSTVWAKVLAGSIRIELEGLLNTMLKALSIIQSEQGLYPYLQCFHDDIDNINLLLKKFNNSKNGAVCWDELHNAFSGVEFGRLPSCGKNADKSKAEQVKDIRNEVKDRLKKISTEVFSMSSEDNIRDLRRLYPLLKCLSELVSRFGARYAAVKREKSLLDFNDLEHFCLKILTSEGEEADSHSAEYTGRRTAVKPSKAALAYRERFDEILIDEYQDSNLVQEVILNVISRKEEDHPNVFMVGDVKQSIYRFRQAKPELFLEKYNTYPDEKGHESRRVQLYKNFRSRVEVVNSVNFIFKQIMSESIGELEYDENEALNPGAAYDALEEPDAFAGGPVELHIIDAAGSEWNPKDSGHNQGEDDDQGEAQDDEPLDAIQCEARLIAGRIKELMVPGSDGRTFRIFDRGLDRYRNVDYKDIVILLRTTRNWAETFADEMGMNGIPAYADTGTGYFKAVEVQIVMSLLQIIDNPMQDIPMLSVLRSPIGGFTPEELADIRLAYREASFYESMKSMSVQTDNAVAGKVSQFLAQLQVWRNKSLHMSTDELVWFLYNDTGYYSYVGAVPGGMQRQANLRILFERARQYEETSYKGLFNFINFINRLKTSQGDMGSAKVLGENDNVVRIMSIHKSKGLEFPVVIVAGCGKKFNLQDMNKSILLHQDLGFGPDLVDCIKRTVYTTVPKQALKYKIKLETLSEEMRILYVAFTRAREKLIITGTVKNAEKTVAGWCKCLDTDGMKLPKYEVLKGRCYLDWIGPAVARHVGSTELRNAGGVDEKSVLMPAVFEAGAEEIAASLDLKSSAALPGKNSPYLEDPSDWSFKLWNMSDIPGSKAVLAQNMSEFVQKLKDIDINGQDNDSYMKVARRLDWQYAYKEAQALPAKMTVTELKRRLADDMQDEYSTCPYGPSTLARKPAFMEETRGLRAAEKGTVLHFVMQHLDFKKAASIKDIEFQVGEMVFKDQISEQQAKSVDMRRVFEFVNSSLGRRLAAAEKLYREVPFNIEVKASDLFKKLDEAVYGGETILLQGVIDCYIIEAGEIILLDYKTDYVRDGEEDIIKERYRVQIEHYAKALELMTGMTVKEKCIYLFWNGKTIIY